MVKVNGVATDAAGRSVMDIITDMGYDARRVAVEMNGDIVSRAQYAQTILNDGDEVEVVSFVGGG